MKKSIRIGLLLLSVLSSCTYNIREPDLIPPCTTTVSFAADVKPIIRTNCAISGCHAGAQSPDLRFDSEIFNYLQRIKIRTSNRTMPLGSSLTADQIQAIACWVDQGALNN